MKSRKTRPSFFLVVVGEIYRYGMDIANKCFKYFKKNTDKIVTTSELGIDSKEISILKHENEVARLAHQDIYLTSLVMQQIVMIFGVSTINGMSETKALNSKFSTNLALKESLLALFFFGYKYGLNALLSHSMLDYNQVMDLQEIDEAIYRNEDLAFTNQTKKYSNIRNISLSLSMGIIAYSLTQLFGKEMALNALINFAEMNYPIILDLADTAWDNVASLFSSPLDSHDKLSQLGKESGLFEILPNHFKDLPQPIETAAMNKRSNLAKTFILKVKTDDIATQNLLFFLKKIGYKIGEVTNYQVVIYPAKNEINYDIKNLIEQIKERELVLNELQPIYQESSSFINDIKYRKIAHLIFEDHEKTNLAIVVRTNRDQDIITQDFKENFTAICEIIYLDNSIKFIFDSSTKRNKILVNNNSDSEVKLVNENQTAKNDILLQSLHKPLKKKNKVKHNSNSEITNNHEILAFSKPLLSKADQALNAIVDKLADIDIKGTTHYKIAFSTEENSLLIKKNKLLFFTPTKDSNPILVLLDKEKLGKYKTKNEYYVNMIKELKKNITPHKYVNASNSIELLNLTMVKDGKSGIKKIIGKDLLKCKCNGNYKTYVKFKLFTHDSSYGPAVSKVTIRPIEIKKENILKKDKPTFYKEYLLEDSKETIEKFKNNSTTFEKAYLIYDTKYFPH